MMSTIQQLRFNKHILKIVFLMCMKALGLYLICSQYLLNFRFQLIFFISLNFIYALLYGVRSNFKLFKIWFKRLILLFAANILIAWLDISFNFISHFFEFIGYSGNIYKSLPKFEFYKENILKTFFTLVNTVLLLDLVVKLISFDDLLSLPLNINIKKKLLFFKSILNFLTERIEFNELVSDMIPEFQGHKAKNRLVDFKFLFKKNLISILTILKLVHEQSVIIGELIENKINHTIRNGISNK